MTRLPEVDAVVADTGFSGHVRVEQDGVVVHDEAYGLADRAHAVPMTPETSIGVASGAKTFTALAVLRLVEEGRLTLDTPARELLGADLPLIDDAVTVEQLLSHRSGIGDYLDEDVVEDFSTFSLPVPLRSLDSAESYLTVLDGFPQKFPPGTGFSYCNGGFCVLALLAERAGGEPFHDLVRSLVIEPAGLAHTAYLRSDALPGNAASGYLHGPDHAEALRTNVLHLPVVGGGDGGIFTTAGDVCALWAALDAGRVVSPATWADAQRSRSDVDDNEGYGLGVWRWGAATELRGSDVGASFGSVHQARRLTWAVLSNTSDGAWPMVIRLAQVLLGEGQAP
jgi:CubicO group peptidase (beta-lactamase class C family)